MNASLNNARQAFEDLKKDHTFVVFEKHGGALRNSYGTSIPEAIPNVVLGDTLPWSQIQPDGVYVTEAYNPRRGESGMTDTDRMLSESANHINKIGKSAIIYSWFDTPHTQKLMKALDVPSVLVGRDEQICGFIEDKSLLQTHLAAAGCERAATPKYVVAGSANDLPSFEDAVAIFGDKFVVQGRSMGGDGTIIVSNGNDYESARQTLKGRVRVSEYVDAPYSSIYCFSLPHSDQPDVATFVDGPSHKPVDIPDLGIGDTAGAGGDWCFAHDRFDVAGLTSNISKLAKYFYKTKGYYGHFVVEGFMRDGTFVFNEINARPGGGSEVNGLYQIEHGLPSFTTAHILGRLGCLTAEQMPSPDIYNHYAQDRTLNGQSAGAYYLKYKNRTGSKVVGTRYYKGSGVYTLDEQGIFTKTDDAIVSTAAHAANGKILITNGPAHATDASVANGKQICTIEGCIGSQTSLVDQNNQLRPDLKRIVDSLPGLFRPE